MALFADGTTVHAADLNGNLPVLLASSVLVAPAANIPLAIPAGFNRIKVYWRVRASDGVPAEPLYLQVNGDTGNDYLWEVNQANNATVAGTTSGAATGHIQIGTIPAASATALYFGSGEFTLDGASDTTNYKTITGSGSAYASTTNMWAGVYGGQWLSAAAVTSLLLFPGNSSNFVVGSSASAYGLM
jgi:hypothetical protein